MNEDNIWLTLLESFSDYSYENNMELTAEWSYKNNFTEDFTYGREQDE